MVAAPGAAPPRLASAALRWPRLGSAASLRSRARRLPERRREIGWSRDCWRGTAANKPALAGLGEIKIKTNKLAKRPGTWGGAWGSGLGAALAGAQRRLSPDLLPAPRGGSRGLDQRTAKIAGSSLGAGVASCPQLGPPRWPPPMAPTSRSAGEAAERLLGGWAPPLPACLSWGWVEAVGNGSLSLNPEVSAIPGEAGGLGKKPRRTSFFQKLARSRRGPYHELKLSLNENKKGTQD